MHSTKLWVSVGLVIVVSLVGLGLWWNTTHKPGVAMMNQGRDHIDLGANHPEYNSNPPTSGWHYETWEKWGKYTVPVDYELQVHNLEHGGIIIHYQPDQISNLPELKALFDELHTAKKKLLLVPNETLDTTYALTAWLRLDTFDEFDRDRIIRFVNTFYEKGPEKTME